MEARLVTVLGYREQIIGRLVVESAADLKDGTLLEKLGPCVGGGRMVKFAKLLRDEGLLVLPAVSDGQS